MTWEGTSALAAVLTVFAGTASYAWYKFHNPVVSGLPVAGGGSISSRLKAPEEYANDPVEFLCRMRKKLGNIFCVDLLVVRFVFLLGADYNKMVLRAPEDEFSFWKQIEWASGPAIAKTMRDEKWLQTSVKVARANLMSQEQIDGLVSRCTKIALEHLEKWTEYKSVPLFHSFSHLVLSCMLAMMMGEEFYRKYGDEIVPKMDQFERDLQNPILRVLPWSLWWLSASGRRHNAVAERFRELTDVELDDILNNPQLHEGRTDYFYFAVKKMGDGFRQYYGTHIMSMVFASHANVALTIPWMFLHSRQHPTAWERIRGEALLPASTPRPYLDACLRETGRLYTNLIMLRMTQKPMNIGGFDIPAGTMVACSPLATQRADTGESAGGIFKDSRQWLPERFLTEGAFSDWFNKAEFIQFGMGAHQCPGEKLAKAIIYEVVLRTWVENFHIEVVGGLEEGVLGVNGVGAQGAWVEQNFGTPGVRGKDAMISCRRR